MLTALIFPYFSNTIDKNEEKKKMVTVLTAIADLKRKCISYLSVGEIEADGTDLVFFLDNREVRRMYLPQLEKISRDLYFNRYGITAGGELRLRFSKMYRIVIEKVSGEIRLEQWQE